MLTFNRSPIVSLLFITLISTLFLLPSACPTDVTPSRSATPTPLNTFDPSTSLITLPPSTPFFLRLKSNPSTGFSWSIHPSSSIQSPTSPSSSPFCSLLSCQYEAHHHQPGMVGVGGEEVWEFRTGVKEGEAVLALQYRRPWMGDEQEASATWTVQVIKENNESRGL